MAFLSSRFGGFPQHLVEIANTGVSLLVFIFLFAALFRLLPDARIEWHEVWYGAVVTGVLFCLGKYAVGIYLGFSSTASSYGAAGSLVVLLLWVYYSAIIFFFGAELTKTHANRDNKINAI